MGILEELAKNSMSLFQLAVARKLAGKFQRRKKLLIVRDLP